MYKIVTCPESSQLELVECMDTPLGSLIHRCTAFRPACAMRCTRGCAVELDRAARAERSGPVRAHEGKLALDFELDLDLDDAV